MKISEFQAKTILSKYGIPVPQGCIASTPGEAVNAYHKIGRKPCVIKAQILTGGRGKSGGIKFAAKEQDVHDLSNQLLGSTITTHQSGGTGIQVDKVLVEEAVNITREIYLAIILDRRSESPMLIISTEGGMEIEEISVKCPEKIIKERIEPLFGIHKFQIRRIAKSLNIEQAMLASFSTILAGLFKAFIENDCLLLEINPLVITENREFCAIDAKISIDDNALYRHEEIAQWREFEKHEEREAKAFEYGFSYISLDGNIGCMVNGAGLAMATMDMIKLFGMTPANFLDVGGNATVEKVKHAFNLILSDPKVKGVLVNIFGGIMKCDTIATGITEAVRNVNISIPLVVRLEGTNENLAKKILNNSDLKIISADGMQDAAEKIVMEVRRL